MSDQKLIRLERLRLVCKDRGLDGNALAVEIGSSGVYGRELLAGKKSFGEKAARKIEEKLGLPTGWLDGDSPSPIPQIVLSPKARRLAAAFDKIKDENAQNAAYVRIMEAIDLAATPVAPDPPKSDPLPRKRRAATAR